ncbi:glycosyltransferase family 2 protein [Aplosporella prunicola CBS 121167]|uniref:Glycosyltransferase family 2 protein n=1 Tax=Aplosporella prunicola CBS 121167 TaxID=1176127 RepID=A0A6A6AVZ5_9PEZI|nr:glycosyltransferase family 2 protein [Aplosporella prunicola CBS 121167]KAF2135870.1 glycosyltransferase family 2 protein [Aplosporella prunicola CBS 121167]
MVLSIIYSPAFSLLSEPWLICFILLFAFRYVRLVVNTVAYLLCKPCQIPDCPRYTTEDVTVIIPTVEPFGRDFDECIHSVIANRPAKVLVVTVGEEKTRLAKEFCQEFGLLVEVLSVLKANKREQTVRALQEVQTKIVVQCDDTVFWPKTLLPWIIAPFENPDVGIVGTHKRVRRNGGTFGLADFWNLCGVMRLERTNFDLASTNAIDGGNSCVSGRTCASRATILKDPEFIHAYTNEYIFGKIGPLNAGDDKFVTRWMINHGWKIKHQTCSEARIETNLGIKGGGARFRGQCLRWARTSARDNPKMLFVDRKVWMAHRWTTYAILLHSLINFAAIYDPLIVFALYKALQNPVICEAFGGIKHSLLFLGLWILAMKLVRPAGHYWRNPKDLRYAPFIILFGYYHSWIKLYALFTCWDISWGTRVGVDDKSSKA